MITRRYAYLFLLLFFSFLLSACLAADAQTTDLMLQFADENPRPDPADPGGGVGPTAFLADPFGRGWKRRCPGSGLRARRRSARHSHSARTGILRTCPLDHSHKCGEPDRGRRGPDRGRGDTPGHLLHFLGEGPFVLDGITFRQTGSEPADVVVMDGGQVHVSACRFTGGVWRRWRIIGQRTGAGGHNQRPR